MAEKVLKQILDDFKQNMENLKKEKKEKEKIAVKNAKEKLNKSMYIILKHLKNKHDIFKEFEPYELSLEDILEIFQNSLSDEDKEQIKKKLESKKRNTKKELMVGDILGNCIDPNCNGKVFLCISANNKPFFACQHSKFFNIDGIHSNKSCVADNRIEKYTKLLNDFILKTRNQI